MRTLGSICRAGVLATIVAVAAATPAAAAKGGNNDTAKKCQKGGWTTLVTTAGGAFANQGDCVNDGAQASSSFGTAGSAACAKFGGLYRLKGSTSWTCLYEPDSAGADTAALQTACSTDTNGEGSFQTEPDPPDGVVSICIL
jgi:hypothetical protein